MIVILFLKTDVVLPVKQNLAEMELNRLVSEKPVMMEVTLQKMVAVLSVILSLVGME